MSDSAMRTSASKDTLSHGGAFATRLRVRTKGARRIRTHVEMRDAVASHEVAPRGQHIERSLEIGHRACRPHDSEPVGPVYDGLSALIGDVERQHPRLGARVANGDERDARH